MPKKINVLILPAGSGIAIAAINSLKEDKDIKVISADCDKLAAGLYLSYRGYIIPHFGDKKILFAIEKIIKREKIDIIIPALDTILIKFSKLKSLFEKKRVKVLISPPETVIITRDKWLTYQHLKEKVPFPKSFIEKEKLNINFPLFIKPREGSGSKESYKINSKEELEFFFKKIDKPIIQEYLEGKEYTVDCLADKEGKLLLTVCRQRTEIKSGISTKARIVKNLKIDNIAQKISQELRFFGPFFFQVKEDSYKQPKVIEINARMAGTMSFSALAGINIHVLAVRMAMGENIRINKKIHYGLYLTRYLKDISIEDKKNKNIYYV